MALKSSAMESVFHAVKARTDRVFGILRGNVRTLYVEQERERVRLSPPVF